MKPKRDITPYIASSDMSVNASLSILKIHKRLRLIDRAYKPASRYQAQHQCKPSTRRAQLRIVK